MSSIVDSKSFTGLAGNTAGFLLKGGKYGLTATGTITSVGLQRLAADQTTFVPAHTALTAAGYVSLDIPPGQYRIAVTGAGVAVDVTGVPN